MYLLPENFSKYKPLYEDELRSIREASSLILSEAGIRMEHPDALRKLNEAGAQVDFSQQMVKIPESVQQELLGTVPHIMKLHGLNEDRFIELNCKNIYMGTGGNVLKILDLETGERRNTLLSDLSSIAFLVDKLDNIDFFVIPVYPHDVEPLSVDINSFYYSLKNTGKHVMGGVHRLPSIPRVIEMAASLAGGEKDLREKPLISFIASITSPRKITHDNISLIKIAGEKGVPIAIAPAPIAGVTSPVTLTGTLIQQNAETLAGLCLSQAFTKGAPALYGAVNSSADFRSMSFLFGSVEMGIMNAAAVQVAHSYNFPIYASAGVTDSKLPDGQASIEKASSILLTVLAGGDYIHLAAGMLESGLTVAYEQYVMDNEILGMARRAAAGLTVSEEHKAVGDIKSIPPGGSYIYAPSTRKYMRSEHFIPRIFNREPFERWLQEGKKDLREKCRESAREILASIPPSSTDYLIEKNFPELLSSSNSDIA